MEKKRKLETKERKEEEIKSKKKKKKRKESGENKTRREMRCHLALKWSQELLFLQTPLGEI